MILNYVVTFLFIVRLFCVQTLYSLFLFLNFSCVAQSSLSQHSSHSQWRSMKVKGGVGLLGNPVDLAMPFQAVTIGDTKVFVIGHYLKDTATSHISRVWSSWEISQYIKQSSANISSTRDYAGMSYIYIINKSAMWHTWEYTDGFSLFPIHNDTHSSSCKEDLYPLLYRSNDANQW